jgi:hypothetical protein
MTPAVAQIAAGMRRAADRHRARGIRAARFVRLYLAAYRGAADCATRMRPGSEEHIRAQLLAQSHACRHAAWQAVAAGEPTWARVNRKRAAGFRARAMGEVA